MSSWRSISPIRKHLRPTGIPSRLALDRNALEGKRIGFIPSTWVDPFGMTNTTDAEIAALQYFVAGGPTIVPMGVTVGGTDTPPSPPSPTTDITSEAGGCTSVVIQSWRRRGSRSARPST
jgi:hypothetical protein